MRSYSKIFIVLSCYILQFATPCYAQMDCDNPSQVWMELTCSNIEKDKKLESIFGLLLNNLEKKI